MHLHQNAFGNHNFYDYVLYFNEFASAQYNANNLVTQLSIFLPPRNFCSGSGFYGINNPCRVIPGTGTIISNKTTINGEGLLVLNFTDYGDLFSFYDSYLLASAYFASLPLDPTTIEYYRWFQLNLSSASNNINCGDNTYNNAYLIHQSSIVTTGTTQNGYALSFTMPIITNQYTPIGLCDDCSSLIDDIVNGIQLSSSSPDYSNTSYVGARYEYPVNFVYGVVEYSNEVNTINIVGNAYMKNYIAETLPFSGTEGNYTFLPSLSSDTCNWVSSIRNNNTSFSNNDGRKYSYFYRSVLFNPSDPNDINIYISPISGFTPNFGSYTLVYTYSAGTRQYIDTNYIIPAY